jgi:hypothetical protein
MAVVAVCAMSVAGTVMADEAAKNALAEELLVLMDVQKSTDQVFDMLRQSMSLQMLQSGKGSAAAKDDSMKALDVIQQELSWEKMKGRYVALYAETFNEEELQGIIAFYKSPAGQAFVKKQPELARRSMELNQQLMVEIMPKLKSLSAPPKPAQKPAAAEGQKPAAPAR